MIKKKYKNLIILLICMFFASNFLSVIAKISKENLSDNNGIYVDEEISAPISKVAAPKINFKSKQASKNIEDFIVENVGLVPNYQIFFSFMIFDDKTQVSLDISALPLNEGGKSYPTTYFYGFLCERTNLARDKMEKHYWQGTLPKEKTIDVKSVDIGPTLVLLYMTLRKLGNQYYVDIPTHLKNKPHYYVSGSIYNNDMYVSVEKVIPED